MGLTSLLFVAFVSFVTVTTTTNAKTVVFLPPPLTSYIVYHTNIAGALATFGHDVWLCVPQYLVKKGLVKDKSIKILEYAEHLGNLEARIFGNTNILGKFWDGEDVSGLTALYQASKEIGKISYMVLSDKTFIDKVKGLNADLFVVDSIPFNMNMIVLPYMLDIPYALIGTIHDVVLSKVPYSPGEPIYPGDNVSTKMTFLERVYYFLYYIARVNFDLFYDSSVVSTFAPHKPYKSINDLAANAEVYISEIDHILDYPRTMLPNTKLVGGSSASPAKPLVGEFKTFVEDSKNGIIVFTFGGSVLDVPPHITSKLISAFQQIDLGVVWKVNITSPDPSRILTSKWIPQNDLLGHNKTKLFISHCGKNGQYEALYHGVPILCLPIYGDQGYNAERITVKEFGLRADMRVASSDELASLMKQIIYNKKYSQNMKKASALYRMLYKVPRKEAAFWLDHVMEYGGSYMRSESQRLPWYQIYLLDVITFLISIVAIMALLVYSVVKQCWRFCRGTHGKTKTKTD